MKFTFKTDKPTGKWRSFSSTSHYIKLDGLKVGSIDDEAPHIIRFMVIKADIMEDGNHNCPWKWIKLSKKSNSVDEAKEWVIKNRNNLTILNLYQSKDFE